MKDKIFDYIDANEALVTELETELTKIQALSPDSGGEGELDKCLYLEAWLTKHGISNLERYDAPDSRAKNGVRPNLIATIPGNDDTKGRFWIMSHLDVVPPGDAFQWDSDPWTAVRKDDGPLGPRFIGRGVEDNQQGLISSVLAALALLNAGLIPPRTVKLLFAADEENGSDYGIAWLINNHAELFRQDDMVLIPDSGDNTGAPIEIAEKHILWAQFTMSGVQAHGSRPDQGINAFLANSELVVALHKKLMEKFSAHDPLFEPDYSTFEPTKKEANVPNINTIPGEDVFYMDMRVLPQYPLAEVLAFIPHIIQPILNKYQTGIKIALSQRMESKATSADSLLVTLLSKSIDAVYSVKSRCMGIGGGTVAAYLRNIDIDAAVWCKIAHTAHQSNEYALIANILGDAKVMALMMMG
ncbi:acetylornithine deacetylase [Spirochaetia bacterium]|nr:acetylornithine deacetylase [Spirochaetia bacterium]